jgi:acetoin utilization deacetylase AcuC-like enzyme
MTVDVFYSPAYVQAAHSFDTTRKAGWIAASLIESPIIGVELVEPEPLSPIDLLAVHDAAYVDAVKTGTPRSLATSQGFEWDEGLWTMALATNGGAVAAARTALDRGVAGSLSSGLHHARRDRGKGFCTFNGLVLAARGALDAGAAAVLILDLDAHCGGGTTSLIADEPRIWHCDVSVSSFDSYTSGDRASLSLVHSAERYLPTIEQALAALEANAPRFDLCVYNAGMDPFEHSAVGGLRGITHEMLARREHLVFAWCRSRSIPIAFVLAGGYIGSGLDEAGLVSLHRLTPSAAVSS